MGKRKPQLTWTAPSLKQSLLLLALTTLSLVYRTKVTSILLWTNTEVQRTIDQQSQNVILKLSTWRNRTTAPLVNFEPSSSSFRALKLTGIVMVTHSSSDNKRAFPLTFKVNRQYAAHNGYTSIVVSQRVVPLYGRAFEKFVLVDRLLTEHKDVNVVVWMNDDAVVKKPEIRIEDWLNKYPTQDILIGAGHTGDPVGASQWHALNPGVMIVRNTPWSRNLFHTFFNRTDCYYGSTSAPASCLETILLPTDYGAHVAELSLATFNCDTSNELQGWSTSWHLKHQGMCDPWVWHNDQATKTEAMAKDLLNASSYYHLENSVEENINLYKEHVFSWFHNVGLATIATVFCYVYFALLVAMYGSKLVRVCCMKKVLVLDTPGPRSSSTQQSWVLNGERAGRQWLNRRRRG